MASPAKRMARILLGAEPEKEERGGKPEGGQPVAAGQPVAGGQQRARARFYAYTKAWDIVLPRLKELPDNFIVIFSLDKTNFGKLREALPHVLEARRLGKRVGFSYVDTHTEEDRRNLEELERIFGEVYECPATNPEKKRQLLEQAAAKGGKEVKVCGDICNYCSTDPKVVKFNVH